GRGQTVATAVGIGAELANRLPLAGKRAARRVDKAAFRSRSHVAGKVDVGGQASLLVTVAAAQVEGMPLRREVRLIGRQHPAVARDAPERLSRVPHAASQFDFLERLEGVGIKEEGLALA